VRKLVEWGVDHSVCGSIDPPGEPKDVEIDKYDRSSVMLKWKEPTDDGGDPIEGEDSFPSSAFSRIVSSIYSFPSSAFSHIVSSIYSFPSSAFSPIVSSI